MMCFTDFVLDQDTQWLVGWSLILSIGFNAFVNIIIVLGTGGKTVYLVCFKFYRIIDRFYDNFCVNTIQLFETKPDEKGALGNDKDEVSFATSILNTLKDPFRVNLSESEDEKSVEETP